MNGTLSLIRRMRKNRRLYIGNDGIPAMQHIVNGYGICLHDLGLPRDEEFECFVRFVRFVHDALKLEMGGLSIWRLIDDRTDDDDEAFELLFALLDEFDAQQKKSKAALRR